jgi:tetratricopeptide (TPR) repeat protein
MFAAIALLVLALAPAGAYNQGNRLYAQKDYSGAAAAYEEALKAGPSAAAHFNLGNALFKSGKIGPAILHYRRARYLSPRDRDVAANLEFARAYRIDKVTASASPFAHGLDTALHRLSRREATVGAAVLFALTGALLAAWIVRRWTFLVVAASLCAVAAVYAFASQQAWATEVRSRPAVVVVSEVNALSGPSGDPSRSCSSTTAWKSRSARREAEYLLVQLPGGGGWIPRNAVQRVYE